MTEAAQRKCVKPGCGALRLVGKPCTDWDCPQRLVSAREHREIVDAKDAEITRLTREGAINAHAVDFAASWAWHHHGLTVGELFSAIQWHPTIRRAAGFGPLVPASPVPEGGGE